jgi:hypothetical protein
MLAGGGIDAARLLSQIGRLSFLFLDLVWVSTRTFEISDCDIDAEGAVFYKIVEPSTGRARVEQVYSPRRGSVLWLARLSNACGIDAPTRWDELVVILFNDAETGFHFDMMGLRVVEHLPETTKGARKGDLFGEDQSDERAVQMQFAGRVEPRERRPSLGADVSGAPAHLVSR